MVSIIICSVDEVLLDAIKKNITDTIGVPFEILAVNNQNTGKGICQVYNETAGSAKFDLLCFLHEDVKLHTHNWGLVISKLLANESVGLVGVSGSVYKSFYPGAWSACETSLYRTHSIQHFQNATEPVVTNINPGNKDLAEVAVLDGVFLATRRSVWMQIKFDEVLLTGFHGYDIDYSLQVRKFFKLVVSYEILLEHVSEGVLDKSWLKASLLVHEKYKKLLPASSILIGPEIKKLSDYRSCQNVFIVAVMVKASKLFVFKYWIFLLFYFPGINGLKHSKMALNYFLKG